MVVTALVNGEYVNLFDENMNSRKKKREHLFGFSKMVGPEVNKWNIAHFCYLAAQNHNIKLTYKSF